MLQEKAYAKINLGLKVLGKRDDGYHEIDMIMHSIGLHDVLNFSHAPVLNLRIQNSPQLQTDKKENLIVKAAKVLKKYTGYAGGAEIVLDKNIPLEAGLAGGSSDAAAALRGLNKLWNADLSLDVLEELAAHIGSDVAFCVRGGTQRATGRGEMVKPLGCTPVFNIVVFKPDFGVSTAQVYKRFSLSALRQRVDIDALSVSVTTDKYHQTIGLMGNELESVTLPMHPLIADIKQCMLTNGADYALMSGSGPSVFAIVPDYQTGIKILSILDKEYQGVGCVTQSMSNS